MEGILKDKGVEHSWNKLGIIRPASHVFRVLPVELSANPLVIGREGAERRRCHLHQIAEARREELSHQPPLIQYLFIQKFQEASVTSTSHQHSLEDVPTKREGLNGSGNYLPTRNIDTWWEQGQSRADI